jgi:hypothetical protein
MNRVMISLVSMICVWIVSIVLVQQTYAGGPLVVFDGQTYIWDTNSSSTIEYKIDRGSLGRVTNFTATQMINNAFRTWEPNLNAPYLNSVLRFSNGGSLPQDITGDNFLALEQQLLNDTNPIIFDNDGSIVDLLVGSGGRNMILGFASIYADDRNIVRARILLNGYFITRNNQSTDEILSTVLHELGHLCGLDHAQHSRHLAYNSIDTDDDIVPIMFPTSTGEKDARTSLTLDDQLAISNLYPNFSHRNLTGTIEGTILRNNSNMPGVNVIARNVDDPINLVSTAVSGTEIANSGFYSIQGLPPGQYEVMVEAIDSIFTETSSVGQYAETSRDRSFVNPAKAEYYNENDSASEGRSTSTLIEVAAAQITAYKDINVESSSMPSDEEEIRLLSVNTSALGGSGSRTIAPRYLLHPSGDEEAIILTITFEETRSFELEVDIDGQSRDYTFEENAEELSVTISDTGDIPLVNERYFISVINNENTDQQFTISTQLGSEEPTPTNTPDGTPTPTPTENPTPTPTRRPYYTPTSTPVTPTATPIPLESVADLDMDGRVGPYDIYAFSQDWRKRRFENRLFESDIVTDTSLRVNKLDLIFMIEEFHRFHDTNRP